MMNDSVREELESKITSGRLVPKHVKPIAAPAPCPVSSPAMRKPAPKKTVTANLVSQKTSKTLVEFQNKNSSLPDWRIQLQNAVQQRKGGRTDAPIAVASAPEVPLVNHGNLALKSEPKPEPEAGASQKISDPRVANAMRRITESRNNFFEAPAKFPQRKAAQTPPKRSLSVVASNTPSASAVATARAKVETPVKPRLVSPPTTIEKRDTNKLPKLETCVDTPAVTEKPVIELVEKIESEPLSQWFPESARIHITAEKVGTNAFEDQEIDTDEIEDLAPFSMRFGAGLFDLIIGGFATMLVLSPLAFTGGNWFTTGSILTFAATWAIVTFLYLTACLGFFGKTMGMRLFQLELVDAVENEYPTLRQAAVNSSVFLVTIAFAGTGFLTVFFNEEKRALHDLVSGTILVREF